jgi:hypothetical protein
MAFFKCIFGFTQQGAQWSEVYYISSSTLQTAAQNCVNVQQAVTNPKVFTSTLSKIRVSEVSNNRIAVTLNPQGIIGGTGGATNSPAVVGIAAIYTLVSTVTGSSRKLWERGLARFDVLRTNSGLDAPGPILQAAMSAKILALAQNVFCIQSVNKVTTPPDVWTNFTFINGVPGQGYVTLSWPTAIALPVAKNIVIRRMNNKLFPGLNGVFPLQAATTTSVQVGWNTDVALVNVPVSTGRWRPWVYNYGAIDNTLSGFLDFNTRDTKKSPLGGRGARRGVRGIRSR